MSDKVGYNVPDLVNQTLTKDEWESTRQNTSTTLSQKSFSKRKRSISERNSPI